jgi:hypothetical protein
MAIFIDGAMLTKLQAAYQQTLGAMQPDKQNGSQTN